MSLGEATEKFHFDAVVLVVAIVATNDLLGSLQLLRACGHQGRRRNPNVPMIGDVRTPNFNGQCDASLIRRVVKMPTGRGSDIYVSVIYWKTQTSLSFALATTS